MEKIPCEMQTNVSKFEPLMADISETIDRYALTSTAVIGILFNVFGLVLLWDKSLKHNFYQFLQCRCFSNLAVCIIGLVLGIFNRWKLMCRADYQNIFIIHFVGFIPIRIAFQASLFTDNLLILNRLVNLFDMKNSIFYQMSKRVILKLFFFKQV